MPSQINVMAGNTTLIVTQVNSHQHNVVLSAAEKAMLRAGTPLTKTSSTNSGHSHQYRIECTGS
jgi:hypothetical protein